MKDFLIIGNMNACTYKEVFPLIAEGNLRFGGFNKTYEFSNPYTGTGKVPAICWFTTLRIEPKEPPILTKLYNPINYPRYDNYEAINVDKIKDIPIDYDGVMGVPITVLKYLNNDNQIELNVPYDIKGMSSSTVDIAGSVFKGEGTTRAIIDGKKKYPRVLIQKEEL